MPDGTMTLSAVATLAAEMGALKRVRDAASPFSVATRLFHRGWAALAGGAAPDAVALHITADTLAATRLGGMDRAMLTRIGLDADSALQVLTRAFDEVADPVPPRIRTPLREALAHPQPICGLTPGFVTQLTHQPRAGATCPGKPRIVLEPPENHADHCLLVAVLGVILAPVYQADPTTVFLAGMAHHLHNAVLPDSGFAGENLLGEHLTPVMRRLFDEALATLPAPLAAATRSALEQIGTAQNPVGCAFNAADVIDRVLEMHHFAQVAGFTVDQALDDLELVHAGPVQRFHFDVLRQAGLSSSAA